MSSLAIRRAAVSAYRSIQFGVEGLDQKRHILEMLLDGLSASLAGAKNAALQRDRVALEMHLARASRIVVGLQMALDPKISPDLARYLSTTYRYFLHQINRASASRASAIADDLLGLANTLRKAFSAQ
jgi:flagellin-specific chaperone FliS